MRCLVVDDDAEIRTSLTAYLQGFGWQVSAAADGQAMRQMLTSSKVDAIVLDLMLPGEDGLSLLRWLGTQADAPPVLMLTARGDTMSRVIGLELGADDYLAKPFEPRELVARLQALVRRASKGQAGNVDEDTRLLRFGRWRFDRMTRQLINAEDVGIALSSAEFRLLAAFTQRPGRVLSRDQLIELTRAPGVEVNDRSIDLAVSRLRAKLGDTAREPSLIRTVRGEGYLFDAEVGPC
ncbi:two-component system OmpR family response regulator [Pelomonas saccharophila]|uniref:Two-component system OmpR family response regulator n=1 Tax=Roseateles saccharophilus TaxID=304 RepID=A0ABU1YKH1_ROSSA|nr:response regulator transcription factor [Roseateles saccharophilus]MDR7269358.1 two-component system OmpR family response regulator [Roseateles saccharophilus]